VAHPLLDRVPDLVDRVPGLVPIPALLPVLLARPEFCSGVLDPVVLLVPDPALALVQL
jgi:hypothetical protein